MWFYLRDKLFIDGIKLCFISYYYEKKEIKVKI